MAKWDEYTVRICGNCGSKVINGPYYYHGIHSPAVCPTCREPLNKVDMENWSAETWIDVMGAELLRCERDTWRLIPRDLRCILRKQGLSPQEQAYRMRRFAECISEIGVV